MLDRPWHDWIAEFASLASIGGVFAHVLPDIVLVMSASWYVILFYEYRLKVKARNQVKGG